MCMMKNHQVSKFEYMEEVIAVAIFYIGPDMVDSMVVILYQWAEWCPPVMLYLCRHMYCAPDFDCLHPGCSENFCAQS